MQAWQQLIPLNSPLTISVNISGKQFAQPHLIQTIRQILWQTGLDAGSLKLEITESVLLNNADAAVALLHQLKALGIQLSIDDFGTGYSSLSYLHYLPIDTLKIDRSFVHNVDCDPEKIEIIRTIIALAWNLGMNVVAEGVETKKQMYQLQALECEFGQGYLFSRPVDANAAKALKQLELNRGETHPVEPQHQMATYQIKLLETKCQQITSSLVRSNLSNTAQRN
jgi:EAL domain-containing protein (putative c-di-GMP-specific phosphodiesterase class I)